MILDPGSIPQLVAAFIFSLIFMLLCAIAAPFKDDSDDYFAKACGFALSAVFFFSISSNAFTFEEDSFTSVNERLIAISSLQFD